MKFKRNIYIVIISIVIYFIFTFIYERIILKDEFKYVYALCRNVSRGDKVFESDLVKVKICSNIAEKYLSNYTENLYFIDDYTEGNILLKNTVIIGDKYIKSGSNNEIVSIKLDLSEDAASYQIGKGSIVNIFYSAKLSEIKSIFNSINKESVISNDLESGYVTLKLLEKVKVINCYDKNGNELIIGNAIDTILVEVTTDLSMKINNLKNYGKFSVSVIK